MFDKIFHHERSVWNGRRGGRRTVNGDSHAFGKGVAISTDKGGDPAKMVDLEVVLRDALGWHSLDNVQIELVGFRDDSDDG